MKIIERIFQLMESKNIKNVELAEYLGINKSVISSWKSRNTNPPSELLIQICELLEVSPMFLLTGKKTINDLTEKEIEILEKFNKLSDENKGMTKQFINERLKEQEQGKDIKDLA